MRLSLMTLNVSFVLLGSNPAAFAAEPVRAPNVVFILADDLGWADTTPYGSTFHETPNLKRLADRSVMFTDYYAASPLCSPTRSSILTGLYPARTGITAPVCHLPAVQLEKGLAPGNPNQRVLNADSLTRLKGEYATLAEVFKESGYGTAHFGKWHLGHGAGYEPRDQGFDLDIPHTPNAAGPGGGYFAPWKFVGDAKFQGQPGEHIDDWMAGQAAKFIQQQKDKPFFLNFWMYSVHSPWNAGKDSIDHFRKTADPNAAQKNPLYAAMVKSMDHAVGKLLDALDAAKIADDTIVVFTSDNGGWAYPPKATDPKGFEDVPATSNAPLRSGKASNYDGGTRVPCLIAWPRRTKPAVRGALFSSVDWFETLTAMTGVKPKAAIKNDGVDQVPAILGGKPCRDAVYVHFPHGSEAQEKNIPGFWPATWVRKGDWKLIRFYGKGEDNTDRFELYDMKHDLGESKNCAGDNPETVKELAGLIGGFLKETEAVIPKSNPRFGAKPAGTGLDGWSPSKDAKIEANDGRWIVTSAGSDPYLTTGEIPSGIGPYTLELKIKSASRGTGRIFWLTAEDKTYHRDRSATLEPKHDGAWGSYEVKLPVEKAIAGLRIDPSCAPGEITFEVIRIKGHDGKVLKTWLPPAPGRK